MPSSISTVSSGLGKPAVTYVTNADWHFRTQSALRNSKLEGITDSLLNFTALKSTLNSLHTRNQIQYFEIISNTGVKRLGRLVSLKNLEHYRGLRIASTE